MNYLVIGRDYPDAFERRQQQRAAHLEGSEKMKKEGKLLYAAAILKEGRMAGSVMIFDFDTEAELEKWRAEEPYIRGDVWGEVEITECAIPPLFSKD